MYGFLKEKTTTFEFPSLTSYVSFFYPVLRDVFLILPASVSYISFVSFSEPLLFPLLYYSSLKLLAFA